MTDLAERITADATTEYDRVEAVQSWLRRNTEYDLDVPRDPPGVDAVDHFLFVTRTGFCEQIASSLAIMLRTLGIPTRLVTGYGPGERNPLTGYFEVKQSDAHAWVEVFYPGIGWVAVRPDVRRAGGGAAREQPLHRWRGARRRWPVRVEHRAGVGEGADRATRAAGSAWCGTGWSAPGRSCSPHPWWPGWPYGRAGGGAGGHPHRWWRSVHTST